MPATMRTIRDQYPGKAEDVTTGLLGAANAALRTYREQIEGRRQYGIMSAARVARDLETRLRELHAVVSIATPDSDFTALAAAQAGIPVVERHLAVAQQRAAQESDQERGLVDRANGMASSFHLLVEELATAQERGGYVIDERRRRLVEIAGPPKE